MCGSIIKEAFVGLDVLGIAIKQSLIEYLEKRGYQLDHKHSYMPKEIEKELARIFG